MNYLNRFLLLGGLLFHPPSSAESKAPIDRVLVFADRAEVTRKTQAQCVQGKAEFIIQHLPVALDQRTLRVEAKGRAQVIGLSSQIVELDQDRNARIAELKLELEKLQQQVDGIGDDSAVYEGRLQTVKGLELYFAKLLNEEVRNPKPDATRWARILDEIRSERLSVVQKQAQFNRAKRELDRKIQVIKIKLNYLRPRHVTQGLSVTVTVKCAETSRADIELSYVIAGATWHPEYDLRFIPRGNKKVGKGRSELTIAAVVQQATGEDWTNALLVLSTAKPRLGSQAPYPGPIYINGHEVSDKKVLVAKHEDRKALVGAEQVDSAESESVGLEDKGQSFALKMPRRVNVMADGRPYWMPVQVVSTKAVAKLVSVPKLKPFAYHLVSLHNPAAFALMSGKMHTYRAGSYVGDTRIDYTAPGEPMEISLGMDQEIKIERRELKQKDRKPGFLSSTKHLDRAYRVEIVNQSPRRQTLEIRENIPVSKIEDVEVELVKDNTTKGYELDSHRGFITWRVPLSKGQKKEIDLNYIIHLPEDWKVNM